VLLRRSSRLHEATAVQVFQGYAPAMPGNLLASCEYHGG